MPLPDAPPLTPARPLHVTYLGNFGSPHSTENHIARSLEWMGHRVLKIQEDHGCWGTIPETVSATESDLLLWTRTLSLDSERDVQRRGLERLRALEIPTAGLHLDRYWDLSREALITTEPFFRVDRLYTADGGNQDRWEAAGVNHIWLPPGVCHLECVPGTFTPELASDIAFVGSWINYHPEWPHRRQLVEWLQATYGDRFRVYPEPGQPAYRGQALRDLYASVKVCVGDSCMVGGTPQFASDRIPETLGRGAFLVHPHVEGMTDGTLWTAGEHLACWELGQWGQLRGLIDYYLEHETARQRIASAGSAHTQAEHTYTRRLEQILAVLRPEGMLD